MGTVADPAAAAITDVAVIDENFLHLVACIPCAFGETIAESVGISAFAETAG